MKRDSQFRSLGRDHSFVLRIKPNLAVSLELHHDSLSHASERSGRSLEEKNQSVSRPAKKKSRMKERSEQKLGEEL